MSFRFIAATSSPDRFPRDRRAEIAFVGRSNVGKSSLLNTLLLKGKRRKSSKEPVDVKQLARTSQTPGRTQSINFYLINEEFYFVDLPGYGYAKAPKIAMEQWKRLAEQYLTEREPLKLVVLIVDIRHGPKPLDLQMKEWLDAYKRPYLVVASKADKLKVSRRDRSIQSIAESFHPPIAFSAATGEGVSAVWTGIRSSLNP